MLPLRRDSDRHEGLGDEDQKRPRGAATPGRQGARDCGLWTNFSPIRDVSSTNQHSERHDHSRAVVREHPRGVDPQVEHFRTLINNETLKQSNRSNSLSTLPSLCRDNLGEGDDWHNRSMDEGPVCGLGGVDHNLTYNYSSSEVVQQESKTEKLTYYCPTGES